MADERRPTSRYRQNIVADTTQLVHNINGKRPEYAQGYRKTDGVYEQYARPKSRRSSVPVSGVEMSERPRTSRGRRPREQQNTGSEFERPMSRRGYAPGENTERPVTRHGRKTAADSVPERPVTRHGRQEDYGERPVTRHGRSQSESSYAAQEPRDGRTSHVDILNLEEGPTPTPTPPPRTSVRMRPKSAKGRVRPKPAPRPSTDRDDTTMPSLVMSPTPGGNITSPTPQPQVITPMPHTSDSRPSSSLNRFNPLPSIGGKSPGDRSNLDGEYYPRPSPRDKPRAAVPKAVIKEHQHPKTENDNQMDSYNSLNSQLQRLKTQENVPTKSDVDKKPVPTPRAKHNDTAKMNDVNSQRSQNEPVIVSVEPELEFQPLTKKVVLPAEPNQSEKHFILAVKLPSGQRPQRRFRPNDSLQTVMNFAELSSQLDLEGCELVCDVPRHLVFRNLKVTIQNSGLKDRTVLHIQVPDEEE